MQRGFRWFNCESDSFMTRGPFSSSKRNLITDLPLLLISYGLSNHRCDALVTQDTLLDFPRIKVMTLSRHPFVILALQPLLVTSMSQLEMAMMISNSLLCVRSTLGRKLDPWDCLLRQEVKNKCIQRKGHLDRTKGSVDHTKCNVVCNFLMGIRVN